MDKVRISPTKFQGKIHIPSSKSLGHREIICAGLADGTSVIDNISMSNDIEATCRCLQALGVRIENVPSRFAGRTALSVTGSGTLQPSAVSGDCGESGSTLRFLIPLAALTGRPFTLQGHGRLVSRPLQAYYDIFDAQQIEYRTQNGQLPLTVNGRLRPGHYSLPGNVSSQFVSGLLFALPLLQGDSVLEITSPLESASYVNLTLSCLEKYGIHIENDQHRCYKISGRQQYRPQNSMVEGDWSQAAFWLVAGSLGRQVTCGGLEAASGQGDRAVLEIMRRMGAVLKEQSGSVTAQQSATTAAVIDAADCPDIIPVLTVLAAVSSGTTKVINAARLRLKECDRLAAITRELNRLGAKIEELPDGLLITGQPEGLRGGAQVDAWNDHRIAMSLAVAAAVCAEPFVLAGAGSVAKSYPDFWQDYLQAGGKMEVLA